MHLGNNLRILRQQRGWNQADFAKELSVNRSKIASYEGRDVQPRLPLLIEIARLFNVTIDDLLHKDFRAPEGIRCLSSTIQNGVQSPSDGKKSEADHAMLENNELKTRIKQLYEIINLKDDLIHSKQGEIEALRRLTGTDHSSLKTEIQLSKHDDRGKFVTWKSLEITSDQYEEISPGTVDRILPDPSQILFEWENVFQPYFDRLNFERDRVILSRSIMGTTFERHYHPEKETLICAKGGFREVISNSILNPGDQITFEPFQPHELIFLEDTLIILTLIR